MTPEQRRKLNNHLWNKGIECKEIISDDEDGVILIKEDGARLFLSWDTIIGVMPRRHWEQSFGCSRTLPAPSLEELDSQWGGWYRKRT